MQLAWDLSKESQTVFPTQLVPPGQMLICNHFPVMDSPCAAAFAPPSFPRLPSEYVSAWAAANPGPYPHPFHPLLQSVMRGYVRCAALDAARVHLAAQAGRIAASASCAKLTASGDCHVWKKAEFCVQGTATCTTDESTPRREEYSRKIFVGGLPFDITEKDVVETFERFGRLVLDWPGCSANSLPEGNLPRQGLVLRKKTGYAFIVFEQESSVQQLVETCYREGDKCYLLISTPTAVDKPVQVRPWRLSDVDFPGASDLSTAVNPRWTVFIGGLPRPTKARDLAQLLGTKFGPVSYVSIDVDPELKYPKGAARVTFASRLSFAGALHERFFDIPNPEGDIGKRVEIKPYVVSEHMCDECDGKQCNGRYASFFCGELSCLQYFCDVCWLDYHNSGRAFTPRGAHRPLARVGDHTKQIISVMSRGDVAGGDTVADCYSTSGQPNVVSVPRAESGNPR